MADAMHVGFRTVDGVRARCAESTGSAAASILLTSPWPESVYAFAPMWSSLADVARLVAVDLPGFGRSERRDDLLSPRAMGEFLVRFVAEWRLEKPHVVAPDIGTSAALFAAASRPGLLWSVVVGSGGEAVPIQLSGPLAEWVLAPGLDGFRAIDPRAIARAYPNELPQLADRLPEINAPVLIIAGRRDRVVPLASAEFLDERLPNGRDVTSNRRR